MNGDFPIAAQGHRRRLYALAAIWGIVCLVLAGRLVQVQAVRHQSYLLQARRQHQRRTALRANRGAILDRLGRVMAVDVEARSFFANPGLVDDPERVAAHFAPLGRQPFARLVGELQSDRHFVYLARQLDETRTAQALSLEFAGVYHHTETRRSFPQNGLAAQVIGYTDVDNRGSGGLEWALDDILRGTDGAVAYRVDAKGTPVPGSRQHARVPEHGYSVVLTLDMVYQDILEQELDRTITDSQADAAMGLIMAPRTGEILAMANLPLFDPHQPGASPAALRRNRSVTDAYEPGSTFKVFTLAAVLEEGLTDEEQKVFCGQGRLRLNNGDIIRDHQPFDTLSVRQVIERSSNIGTIKLARHLSRRQLYEYLRRFGFAARSGSGLPAESAGMLAEVRRWSDRSLETIAIGQEVSVTALQLAQGVGAIANDGLLLTPRIVKGVMGPDGEYEPQEPPAPVRQVVSPQTAARVRNILEGVVTTGTGHLARIDGVRIAGKTGTAQRAAASGRGYDPNSSMVSFVGFLPADDPKLLCLIVVDNPRRGRWGGQVAAPAFGRVIERIMHLQDGPAMPGRARAVAATERFQEIPDLRGMSRHAARLQAGLRGLPVAFDGDGDIVVDQSPPPGRYDKELVQIACALGHWQDTEHIVVGTTLARQANLLRRMQTGPPPVEEF